MATTPQTGFLLAATLSLLTSLGQAAGAENGASGTTPHGVWTFVFNYSFADTSSLGPDAAKFRDLLGSAVKEWDDATVPFDLGSAEGLTLQTLPIDASLSSFPARPIQCVAREASEECETIGCESLCELEPCFEALPNFETGWGTVPGSTCQVGWRPPSLDPGTVLVGFVPLGPVGPTGITMTPTGPSYATVTFNSDKSWDPDRYAFTPGNQAELEAAVIDVASQFERREFFESDHDSVIQTRDFRETAIHEIGHTLGLGHVSGPDPLSVMRPKYYVGASLRAAEREAMRTRYSFQDSLDILDISVSLLEVSSGQENHDHIAPGIADGSQVVFRYTLENLSDQPADSVQVTYCKNGGDLACAEAFGFRTFYSLPPGYSATVVDSFFHTGIDSSEIWVIAQLNGDQKLWNNGQNWSLPFYGTHPTSVDSGNRVHPRVRVVTTSPNPFNPRTTVTFELSEQSRVRVDVYDLAGRHVHRLLERESLPGGRHQVGWDGRNRSGSAMPSGVYFARVQADRMETASKMVLLR